MVSPPTQSAQRLRRAAEILSASANADLRWLGERLRYFLDDGPLGPAELEWYLELDTPPGGTPWHEAERLAERDALLLAIACEHLSELSPGMAAKTLRREWVQYERQARIADISRGYSLEPAGSLRAQLYTLATLGGPPGERRIRDILVENTERLAG